MLKNKFLKMAGVNSEQEFYKRYPNPDSFFKDYPEAQQMAKGGYPDTGTFSGNTYFPDGGVYDDAYMYQTLPEFNIGAMYDPMMYQQGGDIDPEVTMPSKKTRMKKSATSFPFFNPYAFYDSVKKSPKDFIAGLQAKGAEVVEDDYAETEFEYGGLHKYQTAGTKIPDLLNPNAQPFYNPDDPLGVKRMLDGARQRVIDSQNDPNALLRKQQEAAMKEQQAALADINKKQNRAAKFQTGLGLASFAVTGVTNILDRDRKKREEYKMQQAENIYPVLPPGMSGSRGDYLENSPYAFRPDEYVANKGMFTDQNPGLSMGQFGGGIIPEEIGDVPMNYMGLSTMPFSFPDLQQTAAAPFVPSSSKKTSSNGNVKGGSIAVTHNNPGNIHFGNYTSKWGAEKGSPDNRGHVAVFKSIEDGLDAMKKLLFGSTYINLTVSQARNRWVNGNSSVPTKSSNDIVRAIGEDKRLADLTEPQKMKLLSEFVKHEDGNMYKKLKQMNIFKEGGSLIQDVQMEYEQGGVYELDQDQIDYILANGGNIEFL